MRRLCCSGGHGLVAVEQLHLDKVRLDLMIVSEKSESDYLQTR